MANADGCSAMPLPATVSDASGAWRYSDADRSAWSIVADTVWVEPGFRSQRTGSLLQRRSLAPASGDGLPACRCLVETRRPGEQGPGLADAGTTDLTPAILPRGRIDPSRGLSGRELISACKPQ